MESNYFIPESYKINEKPLHYIDLYMQDQYQKEVYIYANQICKKYNLNKVIDVGCGNAFKLMKYLKEYDTIGIECEPCFSFLKQSYPDRKWFLSGEAEKSFTQDKYEADLTICSDVIEHIIDPDDLIKFLLSIDTKYYIISTPCRYVLNNSNLYKESRKNNINGPPVNPCHVREWTSNEFRKYMEKYFTVEEFYYGLEQIECQYYLLTKKD